MDESYNFYKDDLVTEVDELESPVIRSQRFDSHPQQKLTKSNHTNY
jgi:hypothetical protein